MQKKIYTVQDIESAIRKHEDFEKISGIYLLSINPLSLAVTDQGIELNCTESDFEIFIQQILHRMLELSPVTSNTAPQEWASLPGINREDILRRLQETPEVYRELLLDDPNIVLIEKVGDEGPEISWYNRS